MRPKRLWYTASLLLMLAANTLHAQRRLPAQVPPPGGEMTIDTTGQRPAGPAPIVTVSSATYTTVTLRWDAVPGALAYKVLKNPATKPEWLTPTPIPASTFGQPLTFTHTDVAPGTRISYAVWTEFAPASPYSMSNTIVTGQTLPPKNPGNFTATVSLGDINLKWDSVPGSVFYAVSGSGITNAQKVFGTTYTVTGVGAGTHNYTVIAYYDSLGRFGDEANPTRTAVTRKSGRYRITANGFQVHHQTNDHALGVDGWGDEAYVAAYVYAFSPTGASGYLKQTGIYGGKKADEPFRIIVGSASNEGGLASGNSVPNTPTPWVRQEANGFPLEIWSGELRQALDLVIVYPGLWEADGNSEGLTEWQATLSTEGRDLRSNSARLEALKGSESIGPSSIATSRSMPWKNFYGAVDRPIGFGGNLSDSHVLHATAQYDNVIDDTWFPSAQQVVFLTMDTIEKALSNPSPKGAGVIEVRLVEGPSFGGDYTLYLQVERLP